MGETFVFDDKAQMIAKLEALLRSGISNDRLRVYSPHPLHEVEHLLRERPSKLRFFTLTGALTGLATGFFLTIFTSLRWPLVTGGKPIVAIPTFIIIAFELTILFGAIATLIGFLILAKLPSAKGLDPALEFGNRYAIIVTVEERPE